MTNTFVAYTLFRSLTKLKVYFFVPSLILIQKVNSCKITRGILQNLFLSIPLERAYMHYMYIIFTISLPTLDDCKGGYILQTASDLFLRFLEVQILFPSLSLLLYWSGR